MLKKLYFIFLFLPFLVGAQNYPAKPSNYVTDETATLTQEEQNTLNAKLKLYEDTTTNQIFVYVAKSLNGSDLEQLSEEIFHNWKIGQKDKNNGVLIAVFIDDHKFRIQTGYGLEGQLPDLLTKRIQDNDMRPLFKQGDYFGGINAGIELLAYYSQHEFKPDVISHQPQPAEEFDYGKGLSGLLIGYGINLVLLLVLCIVLYGKSAKKRSSIATTVWLVIGIVLALIPCIGGIIIFVMCGLLANLKGGGFSSGGSSWSSSDSSSSWGSSSSDFGGGGGGDSGGGGSSSDW